jgi:nucleoside-diphosphate-sugar epimerase
VKTLVIGGTGATGPYVVNGLIQRGHDVTILHSGQHEVEFIQPVEHIHGDPYFEETLVEALGGRTYELVVCMYGRLRVAAEVFKGRTGRFVGVGGSGGYARSDDPRWGLLGRPLLPNEDGVWQEDEQSDKFSYLMHISEEKVLEAHRAGAYNATMLRPPNMYGPGQLAPEEWCIIRRILDGRKRMIIADGGLKVEARVYVENSAASVLAAIDKPEASAGKRYNVRDQTLYTMRQRIELVAKTMGAELELVDMPFALARPCHVLWRFRPAHQVMDDNALRRELGHRDVMQAAEAIPHTVKWLLEHQPERGGEAEQQLGDPFDYAAEDELIRVWEQTKSRVEAVPFTQPPPAHRYRHPKKPGETWQRPESSSYGKNLPGR